jgi:hypothetical protein
VLRRVGNVLVPAYLAGIVEVPEVPSLRKTVSLPARDVCCIHREQREDFVPVSEERVRLEALEREGRQALEKSRDFRDPAPGLKPGNARYGNFDIPLNVGVQFFQDRRDVFAPERFVNLSDGVDVAHDPPSACGLLFTGTGDGRLPSFSWATETVPAGAGPRR